MNATTLVLAMLFGAIGVGYVIYGRKRQTAPPLFAGAALCAMPYFIDDPRLLIPLSVLAMAAPLLAARLR